MTGSVEVEVAGLLVDHLEDTAVVLLGERPTGQRVLPVVVDAAGARSIVLGLATSSGAVDGAGDPGPPTIGDDGGGLRCVELVALERGRLVAELEVADEHGGIVRRQARPGDAIGIAVRAQVPIGVDRALFDRATVDVRLTSGLGATRNRVGRVVTGWRRWLRTRLDVFARRGDPADEDVDDGVGDEG